MDFMSTDFNLAKNTFCFHNPKTKKVAFVLYWDTKDKFYFNLLKNSFADIIDEPNDHSMVLTRPEYPNYFHPKIPAFDIKYIEDCFKIKNYPDPTKYLIKNTSHSNYTKDDIFDCWLYQEKKWSDLVSLPESKNNICKIKIEPSSTDSISQVTSYGNNVDGIVLPGHSKIASSSENLNDDVKFIMPPDHSNIASPSENLNDDVIFMPPDHSNIASPSENLNDDVKFIMPPDHSNIASPSENLNDDVIFMPPDHSNIASPSENLNDDVIFMPPDHSKIASSSENLNDDVIFMPPDHSNIASPSENFNDDVELIMPPDHSNLASPYKSTRLPYTHEEDVNIVKFIIQNNYGLSVKGNVIWQRMEYENVCIRRTWQSMKARYLKPIKFALNSGNHKFSFLSSEDLKILQQGFNDDVELIMPPDHSKIASPCKNARLPYTHIEDVKIVQYIIKNNYGLHIKGKAMWQRMELQNVCRRRTWQSMKERYLKSIKIALNSTNHQFSFVTPKDLKILRQGLNSE